MATERLQIYKCSVCGNMVEMVHASVGELVCCEKPMNLLVENTTDASKEKHIPVADISGDSLRVRVGSVPHPMEEKHYIEWIELIAGNKAYRRFLKPGDAPETTFCKQEGPFITREYCNIHGLWKGGR